jgi:hypothetical protein
MKFKSPISLQSWLFATGAVLLLLMATLSGLASILAAHEQGRTANGGNPGSTVTGMMFQTPIGILEFAGLSFLILAALVSAFRSLLPSKTK